MVIVAVIPLEKRPRLQGGFGAIFGIASILGPLVGGALTTHVTWRWCFYINLPFGAVGMAVIATCLDVPEPKTTKVPLMEKLKQLDGAGTLALTGSMVCLVLALQWGGQTYAVSFPLHCPVCWVATYRRQWSSGRVIALFTLMGVFAIAFVAAQVFLPRTATIPGRVISQRSAFSGLWAITLIGGSMYILSTSTPPPG
jgi:MFS family permease